MRIRTQLIAAAALAGLVTLGILLGLANVTRQAQAGLSEQAESQQVALNIARVLSLTQQFALLGRADVAVQWRERHGELAQAVAQAARRHDPPTPETTALQGEIASLPPLLDELLAIGPSPATPEARQRREWLTERLLAQTQSVIAARHRWAVSIGAAQQRDQHLYTVLALAAPAALLVLLLLLGVVVARRVLGPLNRLKTAVAAMQAGDLDIRCGSTARDELGDAARAVDAMALALQQQSAALLLSRQRLRTITDNLPALIAYVDNTETYRFTNAHYKTLFGEEADSYVGKTMAQVLGAPARAALQPHVDSVLRGERAQFERCGMGLAPEATFIVNYLPDIGAQGQVDGFYVMALDITTRKHAELRQAASERLLAEITDNLPALVAYVDRDYRYRFANAKYRDWLGADHKAMIGKHVSEAVSEAFYDAIKDHADTALKGERSRRERHTLHDGTDTYHLADYIPDIGPDGQARGFYALTIDITERRRAELAVARSERRLFELTNSIPAMVAYFDMAERCQYANEMALRSLGIAPADVPGIGLREALGENNYLQHAPYVKQALAGRRARLEGKIAFPRRVAHFQAHLIPDRLEGGEQRGFYLMTFDITALKEAQQRQAETERQLSRLALVDALTGLPNRRQFEAQLTQGIARASRERRAIALMFIDIDHFKSINDTLGHAAGDAVLKEFAARLQAAVGLADSAARLAGDEFVVLLEGLHAGHEAEEVAERVVQSVRQPFIVAGEPLRVTTSIGVAFASRPAPDSALMARADASLYEAKAAGRNTWRLGVMESFVSEFVALDVP